MKYREFTKEELKFCDRLQRVLKTAPNTLFMFVGSGIVIYTKDRDNNRYMMGDGVDQNAPSYSIETQIEFDGGDY